MDSLSTFFPGSMSLLGLLLVVVVVAALTLLLFRLARRAQSNRHIDRHLRAVYSPPGRLPFLGHALQLVGAAPWTQMSRWAQQAGKMVAFDVAGQRVLYVNDPALLKRVLQTHQRVYRKDLATSYHHFMCLLGRGLVTSEDEAWRRGRMQLTHALRYDLVEDIPPIALRAVARLRAMLAGTPVGGKIELGEEFRRLTLQVIGEAVLSLSPEACDDLFPPLYLPIVAECNARVWAPWREFMPWLEGSRRRARCLARLDSALCHIVRERWALRAREAASGAVATRRQDMLDRFLSRCPALTDDSIAQLRDEVKTMLLAGHETSAAMLTWATYELLVHPEIAEEVRREFDANLRGPLSATGALSTDQVKQLRWAPAVLRETLRKYSVVPIVVRLAAVDDVVPAAECGLGFDLTIPKGCSVMLGIEGVHHRPDLWPAPERFIPQRFLGYTPDVSSATASCNDAGEMIDPYSFIPFIQGPRNCLGQHVSLMETQIVLASMFAEICRPRADGSFEHTFRLVHTAEKAGERHPFEIPVTPKHGLLLERVSA